ncbi:ABC transporter ATP-binding protein [Nesterenkonia sp. Hz 6-5]|nr:ABC transporter ATP-binding protein [Nesterenkonia haasae]
MITSYLIGTASALTLTAITVLTAWVVGHAIVEASLPDPFMWVALIGLVLGRTILTWKEMDISHALAYRVLARMRMALFDSYSHSVPSRRREHSGQTTSVVMDDIEKLEFFYAHTLAQIATSITVLFTTLVTATFLLPEAGLVMTVGANSIAATALLGRRSMRDLGSKEQLCRSTLSTELVDALGALREVLSFGLIGPITAEALATTDRATDISRKRALLAELTTAIRDLTVTAVVIGVIATSALAAGLFNDPGEPRFTAAALPALIVVSLAGVSAVTEATTTVTQLHPLTASADRVARGIHRPTVVDPSKASENLPSGPLGLRFDHVSFSYDDQTDVLSSWCAEITAGEHVGIAGPSGSGKSTVITLAARLWDPSHGGIELISDSGSGISLRNIEDPSLRKAIAVVDQEATLFHGTVRENLLRGAGPMHDTELLAVLDRVKASEWVTLEDHVGQGGLRLSGGQQARLCLARALVRKPQVLLIDEVTASLDSETERIISDVIADYKGTVLIASHRRETLQRLDRVLHLTSTR